MAATLLTFTPVSEDYSAMARELDALSDGIQLLMGLRAMVCPAGVEKFAGEHAGEFHPGGTLYLGADGDDLLKSIEFYLGWRYASLCRKVGHKKTIMCGRVLE